MNWMKWLGLAVATLIVLVVGLKAYGSWRWKDGSTAFLARLEAARQPQAVARYDAREIEGLPVPVQRYFRAALTDGQAIVTAVSIRHAGTFNISATAEQWKPFTSEQRVITKRPGFDWDARVMIFPGVPVHVHDAYIAGTGLLHGAVLGLVTVVDMADTPEMARGELMRFFAEAAWYPTALLPSQGVHWQAIDAQQARATLTDGALSLTLTFTFGDDGLISRVRAEARGRIVGGQTVPTPWEGRWSGYRTQDGMKVPGGGEVAWLLPGGEGSGARDKPYWRGTVMALRYEFAMR